MTTTLARRVRSAPPPRSPPSPCSPRRLAVAGSAAAEPAPADRDTVALRAATARYNSVTRAIADGYASTGNAPPSRGVGGMGYHDVSIERVLDGVVDPDRPDVLLSMEDANGQLRLAGVEWMAVDPTRT